MHQTTSVFSYLKIVQDIVDEGLYSRGVRLYLDGKVMKPTDMTLDYWRIYQVIGKRENAIVKIPLLHFALSKKKEDQVAVALEESVQCSCEYFAEYGICKHVVAVCAQLEQEWNPKQDQDHNQSANSLLDSLFAVEQEKTSREVVVRLQHVLETGSITPVTMVQQLESCATWIATQFTSVQMIDKKPVTDVDFSMTKLVEIIRTYVGDYRKEKRIIRIISHPTLVEKGGIHWLQFWLHFVPDMDEHHQLIVYFQIWTAILVGATQAFREESHALFATCSDTFKQQLLLKIQHEFEHQPEHWLRFIFAAKMKSWIMDNRTSLDGQYLLLAMKIFPENREEWEICLQNYYATWTDFLPVGDYEEFIKLLQKWRNFGMSDYLKETLDYAIRTHKKKRKLTQALRPLLG